ncbi:MAG: diversity-generating retroelement protein Avd [Candidatus Binatia bacterium]
MKESPIFLKSFETLEWILQRTQKFPKPQRFVMAKRIEEAALDFHDHLIGASKAREKMPMLAGADFHLERLKVYNRLAVKLKLLSFAQYEYLAKELDALGKLLGGWRRSLQRSSVSDDGGKGAGGS